LFAHGERNVIVGLVHSDEAGVVSQGRDIIAFGQGTDHPLVVPAHVVRVRVVCLIKALNFGIQSIRLVVKGVLGRLREGKAVIDVLIVLAKVAVVQLVVGARVRNSFGEESRVIVGLDGLVGPLSGSEVVSPPTPGAG